MARPIAQAMDSYILAPGLLESMYRPTTVSLCQKR